jgi:ferrous iron transport protein A
MVAVDLRTVDFSELQKGMTARVVRVPEPTPETIRLEEMGLTLGTVFKVIKIAPFGDPIEIELRGYRLCLRKRETNGFEVQLLS